VAFRIFLLFCEVIAEPTAQVFGIAGSGKSGGKLLLETTDKSIGEIAEIAGYDTAAGFIHAFRREFKLTPREWRKKEKESEGEDEV